MRRCLSLLAAVAFTAGLAALSGAANAGWQARSGIAVPQRAAIARSAPSPQPAPAARPAFSARPTPIAHPVAAFRPEFRMQPARDFSANSPGVRRWRAGERSGFRGTRTEPVRNVQRGQTDPAVQWDRARDRANRGQTPAQFANPSRTPGLRDGENGARWRADREAAGNFLTVRTRNQDRDARTINVRSREGRTDPADFSQWHVRQQPSLPANGNVPLITPAVQFRPEYRDGHDRLPSPTYERWRWMSGRSGFYPRPRMWYQTRYWGVPQRPVVYMPWPYVSWPWFSACAWPYSGFYYGGDNGGFAYYTNPASNLVLVYAPSASSAEVDSGGSFTYSSDSATVPDGSYGGSSEPQPESKRWPSYDLDRSEAEQVAENIGKGWENSDLARFSDHLSADVPVRIYQDGSYLRSLVQTDFVADLRRTMQDEGTRSFVIDRAIPVRAGEVMVYATHELKTSDLPDNTRYERYTLEKVNGRWIISAFETSGSPLLAE